MSIVVPATQRAFLFFEVTWFSRTWWSHYAKLWFCAYTTINFSKSDFLKNVETSFLHSKQKVVNFMDFPICVFTLLWTV